MFALSPSASTEGITTMGEIEVSPAQIVKRFGPPGRGDDYKMSGRFVFANAAGDVFVVHDWKHTSLWEEGYPAPEDFWLGEAPEEFTISSHDLDIGDFARWFLQQLNATMDDL